MARVKANASRLHTWTAERLEAASQELEALFDQATAETSGRIASPGSGEGNPADFLAAGCGDGKPQTKLKGLLAEIQAADAARRKAGTDPQKNPAQMPKADPESKVMPNKEGGYAPNYTPLAAADTEQGFIVDCDVVADPREDGQTLATVDRIEESFDQKPERFLADTVHGRARTSRAWSIARWSSTVRWHRRCRPRAIRRSGTIRGKRLPSRIGRSCRGTTKRSWPSRASCTMRKRTSIIVPWGRC